jgi:hypothetical protein
MMLFPRIGPGLSSNPTWVVSPETAGRKHRGQDCEADSVKRHASGPLINQVFIETKMIFFFPHPRQGRSSLLADDDAVAAGAALDVLGLVL